jgi:hypothetical protein
MAVVFLGPPLRGNSQEDSMKHFKSGLFSHLAPHGLKGAILTLTVALFLGSIIGSARVVGNATPALAAGCYGHTCEGQSPISTGCYMDQDPRAVDLEPAQNGMPAFDIYHYFSAACQASWNVTVSNSPGLAGAFDVLEFSDSGCTHLVSWQGSAIYPGDSAQQVVGSPMADETSYWVYAATNPDWAYTSWPQFFRTVDCI